MLDHSYIGTEHLLLGLIRGGDDVPAQVLESLGIRLDAARQQVEQITGRGEQPTAGHVPFTSRAKKVLELAGREADALGHDHIGTEHILLGLIRAGDGAAGQVLESFSAEPNRVRQHVIQLVHGDQTKDALARVDSLERRLAALERWVGMRPDLEELDQEIAQVTREKQAAIERQDFEVATATRDKEKQLLAARIRREKEEQAEPAAGRIPLAKELAQVTAELERLRAILREHGIGPGDDA